MSLESFLAPLSDEARALLGRIGRRFGTREVLAQARHTLVGHGRFAVELRIHGFSAADAARLAEARAIAQSLPRADLKITDRTYVLAVAEAKNSRGRARSVLLSAYRRLRASGGAGAAPTLAAISAVLTETAEPGGDDRVYGAHLQRLLDVLAEAPIRAAVAESGGPEAEVKARQAWLTLRQIDETEPPPDNRAADVLDGLIVELCRTAQFAAQSAAKEVGNSTIAADFRLVKLMKAAAAAPDGEG
jgi:hypothetical protein